MAKLICELVGARGRELKLYDTKAVISKKTTLGGLLTGNIDDSEKTIFLSDVIGVQFKKCGALIGYLQFETASSQMNKVKDNTFSENTFTFEVGQNGITNEFMEKIYLCAVDLVEHIKYGTKINLDLDTLKPQSKNLENKNCDLCEAPLLTDSELSDLNEKDEKKDFLSCPFCYENLDFMGWNETEIKEKLNCPLCGREFLLVE